MGWRVPPVPTGLGAGDSGLAPASARADGQESPTDIGQVRSALLGSPSARLVQVDRGSGPGEAGNSSELASCRVSAVLAVHFPPGRQGQTKDQSSSSKTDPADGG